MNKKEMEQAKKIDMTKVYNPVMPWWKEDIYGTELLGMRLLRKKSLNEMSKVTGESVSNLRQIEKNNDFPAPPPIPGIYIMYLSCSMLQVYQSREMLDGKRDTCQEGRTISSKLKREVYEECNHRCGKCGCAEKPHTHRIKEFSKGG